MLDSITFGTALLLGLLGGSHCIGMCGGIAATIGMSVDQPEKRLPLLLSYNTGRICSYAIAGALVGSLSWLIKDQSIMLILRTLAALLLIAMGLYIAQLWYGLTHLEKAGGIIWKRIQPLASKNLPARTNTQAFILGSLWGWLPCGLVYSTLIWTSSLGNWKLSSLNMIAFGLGTLPALLVTGLLAQQFRQFTQQKLTKRIFGGLIIMFGIYSMPWSGLLTIH